MSDEELEELIASTLADFQDREMRGEAPRPDEYADVLGDSYVDFLEVVAVEQTLHELLDPEPEPALPREFGPYTLLRELGRGAAGIVYDAVHRDLGRRQAVKVLKAGFEEPGDALERFRREAKALASIEHPHIVEIHDAGEVDGRTYYAMALVEGQTLAQLLRNDGPQDAQSLCRGLAGVADALHHLHEEGIWHRDVKPSNIMVDADGRFLLADFGLARDVASASLTRSGQALGTPLYMSPEQMLGQRVKVGAASDVYGLGATMYELLSGRPVFAPTDVRALMHKVVNERPRAVRRIRPEVPAECENIVAKALEKDVRDRYASAAAMRDDLTAFADGKRVVGRPVSHLRRAARRARVYALPIAALFLLTLGAFLWMSSRPGTLSVESMPVARLQLDGEDKGMVPQQLEVAPGTYRVVLEREHFKPFEGEVEVRAGQEVPFKENLVPLVPGDPVAIAVICEQLGEIDQLRKLAALQRHRGMPRGGDAVTLIPSGVVAREALQRYVVYFSQVGPDEGEGAIVFWRTRDGDEDEEEVYREPLEPELQVMARPFPPALLSKLADGDVVRWGYVGRNDEGPTTTFEVRSLPEDTALALAGVRARTAHLSPLDRTWIEGIVLLHHERPAAAYLRAFDHVFVDPDASELPDAFLTFDREGASILPWTLMREATIRLGLADTPGGSEANFQVESFPEAQRSAVFGD